MARHLPSAEIEGISAGLHLVARLAPYLDERQIPHDARQRAIRLYDLTDYEIKHHASAPGLLIGYAGLTPQAIHSGIAELAALTDELRPGGSTRHLRASAMTASATQPVRSVSLLGGRHGWAQRLAWGASALRTDSRSR